MGIFSFFKKFSSNVIDSTLEDTRKRMLKEAGEQGLPETLTNRLNEIQKEKDDLNNYLKEVELNSKKKEEEKQIKREERRKKGIEKYEKKYGEVIGEIIYIKSPKHMSPFDYTPKEEFKFNKKQKDKILEIYGNDKGQSIIKKEPRTDYTLNEVYIILGEEKEKETSILNGKNVEKLFFEPSKNRLGNITYSTKITLIDGKISNWTDLKIKSKSKD